MECVGHLCGAGRPGEDATTMKWGVVSSLDEPIVSREYCFGILPALTIAMRPRLVHFGRRGAPRPDRRRGRVEHDFLPLS